MLRYQVRQYQKFYSDILGGEELISMRDKILAKRRTGFGHKPSEAPAQEFNRLSFKLYLPALIFLEEWSRGRAERAVI